MHIQFAICIKSNAYIYTFLIKGDYMIKYDKAFALLKEHGYTTYRIRQDKIIGQNALQAMRENRNINTKTIDYLCKALNCQPGDLMEWIPDQNE